jgi:hypothetical protein
VVVHVCNPSTQEANTRSWNTPGHPGLSQNTETKKTKPKTHAPASSTEDEFFHLVNSPQKQDENMPAFPSKGL